MNINTTKAFLAYKMNEIPLYPFIFPAFLSLFSLWFIKKWLYKPNANKNLPPSPPKLPILGNIHQLGSLPHQNLRSLAQKYGPLMLLHFGRVPVLIVSSADAASEILRTHDLIFASRPEFKVFKKLMYDGKNITFSPYGEYWRKLKSMFVLQLLSTKRVQSFRPIREDETTLLVKRIGESLGNVNLSEMFGEFTNDVIFRSAFGTKYRELGNGKKLLKLLVEFMELLGTISIGDFIPWLSWIDHVNGFDKKLDKVAKEMDDFLEHVIQQSLESRKDKAFMEKEGDNFVDVLLEIHNKNAGDSIGRDSIKALLLDVIEGGTDTISTALEWVMAELLRHPTVMKKLQNEVREIAEDKENIISDDDLEKMPYLKAVIKETLRYHPPAVLLAPRVTHEDVKIKEYDVPKGTVVMVNNWAIGRDPLCCDEPEKFKPERFFNHLTDSKGSNFGWIPFGAGRRGCPRMTYSMATIELLVANIVQKFDWKLPKGVVLDMTETAGLTAHRAIPLVAVASKAT